MVANVEEIEGVEEGAGVAVVVTRLKGGITRTLDLVRGDIPVVSEKGEERTEIGI